MSKPKNKPKKESVKDRAKRSFNDLLYDTPASESDRLARPSSQIKTTDAAGAFDESFDYDDPTSQGYLPEHLDGVIQMSTPEQRAADRAYKMALEDPLAVIGPRLTDADYGYKGIEKTMREAGHRLELKRVTEHHDPERLHRIRDFLGVDPEADDRA